MTERVQSQPLRVGIDCQIRPGQGSGGIETFLAALVHALGCLPGDETEFVLIVPWESPDWLRELTGPNQRVVPSPNPAGARRLLVNWLGKWGGDWLRSKRGVARSGGFYEGLSCDVLHFPFQKFVRSSIPTVYNPHDLQYLHFPEFFHPGTRVWRETVDRTAMEAAMAVVVSSGFVKDDIVRSYGVDPAKIQVIPGAPPMSVSAAPDPDDILAVQHRYGLFEPFMLYPAMTWPHKNHVRLLEAMALLRDRGEPCLSLVCTGHKNDFWIDIERRVDDLSLQSQARFLGLLPSKDLRALYKLADFVILPTLFEATSGPLLEAWLEGTPVACSSVTALPEQAGDAALLFDPFLVESIANAIARMSQDPALRSDLGGRGSRRLRRFNWEKTAKAYVATYRRVAGRPLNEEERALLSSDWTLDN